MTDLHNTPAGQQLVAFIPRVYPAATGTSLKQGKAAELVQFGPW